MKWLQFIYTSTALLKKNKYSGTTTAAWSAIMIKVGEKLFQYNNTFEGGKVLDHVMGFLKWIAKRRYFVRPQEKNEERRMQNAAHRRFHVIRLSEWISCCQVWDDLPEHNYCFCHNHYRRHHHDRHCRHLIILVILSRNGLLCGAVFSLGWWWQH